MTRCKDSNPLRWPSTKLCYECASKYIHPSNCAEFCVWDILCNSQLITCPNAIFKSFNVQDSIRAYIQVDRFCAHPQERICCDQCARCGHGPVLHANCNNLSTHHGLREQLLSLTKSTRSVKTAHRSEGWPLIV